MSVVRKKTISAFTLVEMSVIMAAFFVIAVLALPGAISQIQTTRAVTAMKEVKSAIYLAEQDAYTAKENSGYGVAFLNDHYVVYTGNSLATATSQQPFTFNNNITIENINFNGNSEVSFAKGSFRPVNAGTVDIRSGSDSYRITISSEGLITSVKL